MKCRDDGLVRATRPTIREVRIHNSGRHHQRTRRLEHDLDFERRRLTQSSIRAHEGQPTFKLLVYQTLSLIVVNVGFRLYGIEGHFQLGGGRGLRQPIRIDRRNTGSLCISGKLTIVRIDCHCTNDPRDSDDLAIKLDLSPVGVWRHTSLVTASYGIPRKRCRLDGRTLAKLGNAKEPGPSNDVQVLGASVASLHQDLAQRRRWHDDAFAGLLNGRNEVVNARVTADAILDLGI